MGSPEDEPGRFPGEDQVAVSLTRGYWLGKYEVTQEEYKMLVGSNPSRLAKGGTEEQNVEGMDTSRFPVDSVSWHEAMAFCEKLTDRDHMAGFLPKDWKYALPTEAQWEYSCRAGTTTATAFGESLSSRQANFRGDEPYNGAEKGPNLRRPAQVGSYTSNAWGLCDMHGNVAEWCQDVWAGPLIGGKDPLVKPHSPSDQTPSPNDHMILRGGCWFFFGGEACRSASREMRDPENRLLWAGFRVAVVPSM